MSIHCAFLGDEVTGAGFRLAGARVHSPAPGDMAAILERLLGEADLVILTAEAAEALPPALLTRALTGTSPPVLLVPDAPGRRAPPDLATQLKGRLGMAE